MQIDMTIWQGRDDTGIEGMSACRWHQKVQPLMANASPGVVLTGFCSDAGVARNGGRIGAAAGPRAIRAAMANLAWHQPVPVYDAGDVVCEGDQLEAAQSALAAQVSDMVEAGHLPVVLGGGHEVAWGTWQGLVMAKPEARIGIINIDAHFDLRQAAVASSGTPFAQAARDARARGVPFHYLCLGVSRHANTAALFETARQTGTRWIEDHDFAVANAAAVMTTLDTFLAQVEAVHFTICLDAFPGSVAPGVSAPAARGVGIDIVEMVAARIAASRKLAALEIAEMSPPHDVEARTAKLAARLVAETLLGIR